MRTDVVEIASRRGPREPAPVSDFWFAQVDRRLGRIEGMIGRLERQLWAMIHIAGAILATEALRALVGL